MFCLYFLSPLTYFQAFLPNLMGVLFPPSHLKQLLTKSSFQQFRDLFSALNSLSTPMAPFFQLCSRFLKHAPGCPITLSVPQPIFLTLSYNYQSLVFGPCHIPISSIPRCTYLLPSHSFLMFQNQDTSYHHDALQLFGRWSISNQTCRIGVSSVEDPRDSIGIWEPMIVGQRDSTSGNQMIVGQRVSELTPTQESKVCDMA